MSAAETDLPIYRVPPVFKFMNAGQEFPEGASATIRLTHHHPLSVMDANREIYAPRQHGFGRFFVRLGWGRLRFDCR